MTVSFGPSSSNEALVSCREALYALGEDDPAEAVRQARALEAIPSFAASLKNLQAGILIDVGGRGSIKAAVEEGISLLRSLREAEPKQAAYGYNLANGLEILASLEGTKRPAWYLATRAIRQEARALLHSLRDEEQDLATQALTNLGNALSGSYRWSEAYDAYIAALGRDTRNGMAAGCAAQLLLHRAALWIGDSGSLQAVASRYVHIAQANSDRVMELGGPRAVGAFAKLPVGQAAPERDLSGLDGYLRFVADHHLALVLTIEGLDPKLRRWDSLHLHGIREPLAAGPEPPPVFAMFNTIKAGYLLARRLAFRALSAKERQTGYYADTLDYAIYGTNTAALILAQRAAVDVLDQLAVAVNEYLRLGLNVRRVDFSNLWRADTKKPEWRPALDMEISKGNTAIVALGELAEDFAAGFLRPIDEARNTSTHRFSVLHDEGVGGSRSRPCEAIEHANYQDFVERTIETLKVVRAAILYFAEIVLLHEHHDRKGVVLPLFLPAHHTIPGERP
jgi:hypothetical protein